MQAAWQSYLLRTLVEVTARRVKLRRPLGKATFSKLGLNVSPKVKFRREDTALLEVPVAPAEPILQAWKAAS